MIESALLGGILGGIARLAPEVMKVFDRKNERQHELAMSKHELEVIKIQGHQKLESEQLSTEAAQIVAGLQAVQSAQTKTGFKFADTVNALVRPWITMILFHTYLAVKWATYYQLQKAGISWDVAIVTIWNNDDVTMLAGVTNFWFLSRVFDKK